MKIILGCAAAMGVTAYCVLQAPTAAADINVSGINIGNQGNAKASFGNVAIALGNSQAEATGGIGNVAVALGGSVASKQGPGSFNIAAAAGQGGSFIVDGSLNVAATLGGTSHVTNSNFTFNAAVGGNSKKPSTTDSTNITGSVQTAFCGGTSTSAQGRINVHFGSPCFGG